VSSDGVSCPGALNVLRRRQEAGGCGPLLLRGRRQQGLQGRRGGRATEAERPVSKDIEDKSALQNKMISRAVRRVPTTCRIRCRFGLDKAAGHVT
jgi:hypothetical protein